jgi:hypothetical protein
MMHREKKDLNRGERGCHLYCFCLEGEGGGIGAKYNDSKKALFYSITTVFFPTVIPKETLNVF